MLACRFGLNISKNQTPGMRQGLIYSLEKNKKNRSANQQNGFFMLEEKAFQQYQVLSTYIISFSGEPHRQDRQDRCRTTAWWPVQEQGQSHRQMRKLALAENA